MNRDFFNKTYSLVKKREIDHYTRVFDLPTEDEGECGGGTTNGEN